jgi:hypothetical protein
MKKIIFCSIVCLCSLQVFAQFEPAAGQVGTNAIYKDSSVFTAWATQCFINRGYQDISNTGLGYASTGDSSMAVGIAGNGSVVSLGDGGYAILMFDAPIFNGAGPDFAVFENGYSDTFLELAFVEVSSDGINYFRFPATSNTQDSVQIGSFGSVDCTKLNNLAGKYRANFGTPFDLQELANQQGLDINAITHIKLIDVVGCIQSAFATFDQNGHKVNDPWNTAFASGGFDLDAVGVIHQTTVGLNKPNVNVVEASIFPNPTCYNPTIQYTLLQACRVRIVISDYAGRTITCIENSLQAAGNHTQSIDTMLLPQGNYFIRIEAGANYETLKFTTTCD